MQFLTPPPKKKDSSTPTHPRPETMSSTHLFCEREFPIVAFDANLRKTVFPGAKSNNGNFFIVYFCTALCLYCWGCFSEKSWADCESKLESKLCPRDEKGSVCQIEEYTETNPGGVTKTYYFKTCGLQSHCDGSECNFQEGNVTQKCVFHCCCYDNCNTGILWVSAGCHWLSQICYAVPTCRMLVFKFNLKQITELPWLMT